MMLRLTASEKCGFGSNSTGSGTLIDVVFIVFTHLARSCGPGSAQKRSMPDTNLRNSNYQTVFCTTTLYRLRQDGARRKKIHVLERRPTRGNPPHSANARKQET